MISVNEYDQVVVAANGRQYNLGITDQYADFLMWITSPEEIAGISSAAFNANPDLQDQAKARAERYAAFLNDFTVRRQERMEELNKSCTWEQRKTEIDSFITRLKGQDE